jgi:hypothetical protein
MKLWKFSIIVAIILLNFVFVSPSWADRPNFTKNSDYIEITNTIEELSGNNDRSSETERKIADLEFLQHSIESGVAFGQCTNNTGKILAVYGRDPDDDDDDDYKYDNELYFLADGQTTDNKWDCDGFYVPNEAKAIALSDKPAKLEEVKSSNNLKSTAPNVSQNDRALTGPVAVKILDGTKVVVKTNPGTGNLEFNAPLSKIFQVGEINWYIPQVAQATVDSRVPNAPIQD